MASKSTLLLSTEFSHHLKQLLKRAKQNQPLAALECVRLSLMFLTGVFKIISLFWFGVLLFLPLLNIITAIFSLCHTGFVLFVAIF